MKSFRLIAFAMLAVFVLTGCVQVNSSDAGSMNIHPSTVGPTDDYRPLYKVDSTKKVTAESSVKCLFWIFTWGTDNAFADNLEMSRGGVPLFSAALPIPILARLFPFLNAKATAARAAFYKACKQADCDAIVAARYEITFEDLLFFKEMRVTVTGFPAKLVGVETVNPMPYYIDGNGKVVVLDKMVKPVKLFDGRHVPEKRGFISLILKDTLGLLFP